MKLLLNAGNWRRVGFWPPRYIRADKPWAFDLGRIRLVYRPAALREDKP